MALRPAALSTSAGFYLVLVQPFRLGDRVAVSCNMPGNSTQRSTGRQQAGAFDDSSSSGSAVLGAAASWFEGVCEKVDLRYTVLR